MSTPPAAISEADWVSWPAGARELILSQQEQIEELRAQLAALASKGWCGSAFLVECKLQDQCVLWTETNQENAVSSQEIS
jgi:hypothetical protein